jgi:NAD(P) transhydrogenase
VAPATYDYDLLVIGSGPAGQKAAIQAAKLGRRAAVVERRHMVGGVCTNTGTLPSKTLREAVLYLTGMSQRGLYGQSYRVREEITIEDLLWRTQHVIDREIHVIRDQLARNHVTLIGGEARFVDSHTLSIDAGAGEERRVSGERIVIAVGTRPVRPKTVAFDDGTVLDSDGILELDAIPKSLVVVGAGVIGIEYASMFAALGTRVTVVEARNRLLPFCDSQVVEALQYQLRDLGVIFRFGESVTGVDRGEGGTITHLASGKRIPAEAVLYSAGRQGATDSLDLAQAGLEADARGIVKVGPTFQTAVKHIYAVGDVIGFPSLAATSMEQGRIAACCAFGEACQEMSSFMPYGIYTIPEISFAGRTEEELTEAAVPYEIGISRWRELARGQILGDQHGLLKLLVSAEDHTILGVHVFGTGATEVVHIGQAVMGLGGSVEYLVESVFNYPTLAESYKVAALDAMNKLRAVDRLWGVAPPPPVSVVKPRKKAA